jgi:hypothetical protein
MEKNEADAIEKGNTSSPNTVSTLPVPGVENNVDLDSNVLEYPSGLKLFLLA